MRIATIGCKGVPASATPKAGGVETYVEELSIRLVQLGHEVTVYARPYANPDHKTSYKGIKIITLPTIQRKNFDAIVSTFLASIHVLFQDVDIIHYHGVGPSTLSWIPRIFKPSAKVVVTFHSRDRFHEKWSWLAKAYLSFGEWTAVTFPHLTTTPSQTIQLFCRAMFHKEVKHIPNAVDVPDLYPGTEALKEKGVEAGEYFFALSRFIPHKAIEDIIDAFKKVETSKKLLIIGSASPDQKWYEQLLHDHAEGDRRVIFAGHTSGLALKQLLANSFAMIHASRSEGLSVAILEGMSYGKMVIMSDIPENLELIDHSGISFPTGDIEKLAEVIRWSVGDPEVVKQRGHRAREVIKELYSWDSVVKRMEYQYQKLLNLV
jgi:glycosyltransferase involved in cell wall biosynthesis